MSKGVISGGESEPNRNSRADLKTDVRSDSTITSARDVHVGQDRHRAAPRVQMFLRSFCELCYPQPAVCVTHRDTNQSVAKRP